MEGTHEVDNGLHADRQQERGNRGVSAGHGEPGGHHGPGEHRGPGGHPHRQPPIEGMQRNPCGGFNPNCPANPNPPEMIAQLVEMHEKAGHQGPPPGRPDFSEFPERPCGHRKPHCPLQPDG